ncbi:hypothetical protein EV715DRAFT_297489 [Schizophyllum commune]
MSYITEAQSFYLTEETSHYLRRLHLANLPWALTCPLESPLALEIRSRLLAQQCVTTAGANSPQAATAMAAGTADAMAAETATTMAAETANAMAAETAIDDITATAAFADNVFGAAAPVFELAAPVLSRRRLFSTPVFKSTDNVFEPATPVFEPAANDDANRSGSTTSSRDFLTGFASDFLTGFAYELDVQVASDFLTEFANELDVQVEDLNAISMTQ